MNPEVTLAMIEEAAERILPIAHRTPVLTSRSFDAEAGARCFFKCENLQRGGAFKIRGAANLVFSLPKQDLARGIVAYSSGNHAQATAIAAATVGAECTIVMPSDAPRAKIEATRGYGARIVMYDRLRENREEVAAKVMGENGAVLVPPFDHPMIIAGQGTAARELLADNGRQFDALIAPVGGGGLLSGSAVAARALCPGIRIFGAEPELANDTYLSFQAGKPVAISSTDTIADGLRAPQPGRITFPILQRLVERIVLVSEEEIRGALKFLLTRMKILVEPSGAAAAAAVLYRKLPEGIRSVGIVLSGGNVDYEQLAAL